MDCPSIILCTKHDEPLFVNHALKQRANGRGKCKTTVTEGIKPPSLVLEEGDIELGRLSMVNTAVRSK